MKLFKNDNDYINLCWKDDAGVGIDITTYTNFYVYLYLVEGNKLIDKYSRVAETGFNSAQFDELDQATTPGVFRIYIDGDKTKNKKAGAMYILYKEKTTNAIYADGYELKTLAVILEDDGGGIAANAEPLLLCDSTPYLEPGDHEC